MFISDLLPSMGGSIESLVQTTAVKKFMKLHSLVIQSIRKTNKQIQPWQEKTNQSEDTLHPSSLSDFPPVTLTAGRP